MRLVIILLFFVQSLYSQVNTGTGTPVPPHYDIMIEMSCGFAGKTSPELISVKQAIAQQNFSAIKKLLKSKNHLNQILAVIAVESLASKQQVKINKAAKKRIEKIKASKKSYFLCGGDNLHHYSTVASIFNPDLNSEVRTDIAEALRNQLGLNSN